MKSTFICILSVCLLSLSACLNSTPSEKTTPTPITISGRVTAIENGKDGYTAQVQTTDQDTYAALVSIVNLGDPGHFQRFEIGDKVTLSGIPTLLNEAKQLKVDQIIKVETGRTTLLITADGFRGITVGDPIAIHADYSRKEKIKTGEGDFMVYLIKDFNHNPAGFFMPDPRDESKVGDITIETPMAKTEKGINVGTTFGALKKVIPSIEVHGSEIESRTYAIDGQLSYRLDIANNTYDVDQAKIPLDTKITQIVINRK